MLTSFGTEYLEWSFHHHIGKIYLQANAPYDLSLSSVHRLAQSRFNGCVKEIL